MSSESKKNNFSTILISLAAAMGYGAWAVYANFEHAFMVFMIAGLIQASYAFLSTLCITHVARWVFLKFKCGLRGVSAGFVLSFLLMFMIPITVHSSVGTPDVWQTILPGLIWGSIYLLSFLITLDFKLRILPAKRNSE